MADEQLGQNQFHGGVFSKELPGGRASATITLDYSLIRAVTSGGDLFELRYDEVQLEMGGASGKMVFCRNADRSLTIFCEEKRFLAALEAQSSGMLRSELDQAVGKRKRERRRGRTLFWVVTLAILASLVGAYFGIQRGARLAVRSLPFSIDEQIGQLSVGSLDAGVGEVRDPQVVAAIEQLVARLAPHSAIAGIDYKVRVVESPEMNAYALPGGYITVFTGLIAESKSPEEVAGVLAHEMAHVTMRHGLERIAGQLGIVVGVQVLLGDVSGLLALGVELGQFAAQNSYSRSQETEADLEGARMLHDAGIDPLAMARFFENLAEQEGANVPAWLSTHPDTRDRIERLRELAQSFPEKKYSTFEINWEEIKDRVRGVQPPADPE